MSQVKKGGIFLGWRGQEGEGSLEQKNKKYFKPSLPPPKLMYVLSLGDLKLFYRKPFEIFLIFRPLECYKLQ